MTAATPSSAPSGERIFDVEIADKVAHIRLARPEKLNSMVPRFWSELPQIVRDISDNARARCIVISSTGRHFSSGMDLAVFSANQDLSGVTTGDPRAINEAFRHKVLALQETFSCLDEARMPVLVAIQGGCIGGAVDMVSACDIRYCTADAFFQIQEINIGMTADVGTFPRLCKLMPDGLVRELAYTGRRLAADRALKAGLVNDVFADHATMMTSVMETAREIASKAPLAVTGSKMMITYAKDHSTRESLDRIALWQTGMFAPDHMREAFMAMKEKRQPRFPDLAPIKKDL
jgi:enoyl-CoA hydratase